MASEDAEGMTSRCVTALRLVLSTHAESVLHVAHMYMVDWEPRVLQKHWTAVNM